MEASTNDMKNQQQGKHAWSINSDIINNNIIAPRAMTVLKPLKVQITNFPSKYPMNPMYLEVRDFAPDAEPYNNSTHLIPFERLIYIDRSDYVSATNNQTPALATGQMVGLLHTDYAIKVTGIVNSSDDINVVECLKVVCHRVDDLETPPDTCVHWVSALGNFECEVRLMGVGVPGAGDGCSSWAVTVIPDAVVDVSVKYGKPGDKFEFERVGLFCMDSESRVGKLMFNQVA